MRRRAHRNGRAAAWVIIAMMGSFAGLATSSVPARACTCAPMSWFAHLESVTSSDPTVDHTPFWPQQVSIHGHYQGSDMAFKLVADASPGFVRSLEAKK